MTPSFIRICNVKVSAFHFLAFPPRLFILVCRRLKKLPSQAPLPLTYSTGLQLDVDGAACGARWQCQAGWTWFLCSSRLEQCLQSTNFQNISSGGSRRRRVQEETGEGATASRSNIRRVSKVELLWRHRRRCETYASERRPCEQLSHIHRRPNQQDENGSWQRHKDGDEVGAYDSS